ncbi:MAG: hypothetical protein C4583_10105 [Anaerolineaceae bacterium]|nr:MAG: hypothetical protein C4583_10105 [Anaerolineaceae bacterium]
MNKWGVRLIALLFIILAISNIYQLITGAGHAGSDSGITYNGKPVYIMDGIWAGIYVYIGFHLLKFHQKGRDWALFLLWPSTILVGLVCIWVIVISIQALYTGTTLPFYLNPKWGSQISDPITVLIGTYAKSGKLML